MKFRTLTGCAVALMYIALIQLFILFLSNSVASLTYPFGIDFGEGIVWQQALLMFGPDAYGPINIFPSIVFHYPPVYHVTTLSLSALTGWDMLFTGRAISISSTLLILLLICLIVMRGSAPNTPLKFRLLAGTAAGLTTLSFIPIYVWSPLMRVDMMALLLTLIGFWFGLKSYDRPNLIYVASLFFVAAVFAKQTTISAPIATFGLMIWLKPRLALKGVSTCIISGLITLGALNYITDGGFFKHIFFYNINVFDLERLFMGSKMIAIHGLLLIIVFIVIRTTLGNMYSLFRGLKGADRIRAITANQTAITFFSVLLYLLITTPMLLLFAKEGSAGNYFIEWFIASALLIGFGLLDSTYILSGMNYPLINLDLKIRALGVPLIIASYIFTLNLNIPSSYNLTSNSSNAEELKQLSSLIRESKKPVISDDMVIILRNGKRVVWESAIFAQLEKTGAWNAIPFERKIRNSEFSMFITEGNRGEYLYDQRYTPLISKAITDSYPIKKIIAGYTIHLPENSELK
jgi:hypothetical protein